MTIAEQKAALRTEIVAMAPSFNDLQTETLAQLRQIRDGMLAQLARYKAAGFEVMDAG